MRRQTTAVLAVAGLASLALAAPASAAPGNGAEHYSESSCFSEQPDPEAPTFRVCFTVRGHFNVTETPSGNFHVTDHSRSTFTFTSQGLTDSGTSRDKLTFLLKDGREQVVHTRGRFSNTSSDGVTCRGSFRFMSVKGEVKKEIYKFSCDGLVSER